MRFLLDTHVLLWSLFEPSRIHLRPRQAIENPENEIYVSALSFWEISLKYQIGKLELKKCKPDQMPALVEKMGMEILPMDANLLASSYQLPLELHKDPFDRMLAWQSIQGSLTLITKDSSLQGYHSAGLKTFW